jgi:hypothetical protein
VTYRPSGPGSSAPPRCASRPMDPQTPSWLPTPRPRDAFTARNRRGNQTLAAQQHRREPRRRSHRPSRSGVTWRTTSNPGSQPATIGPSTTARSRNRHCRRRRGPRAGSAPAREGHRASTHQPNSHTGCELRLRPSATSDKPRSPSRSRQWGNSVAPSQPEPRPSLGTPAERGGESTTVPMPRLPRRVRN